MPRLTNHTATCYSIGSRPTLWRRLEGPTWLVLAVTYGGWLLLTGYANALPWWLLLPFGGGLLCLHSSLQHELIHGHPTPHERLNRALGFPPLGLWLPYPIYRESHIQHHRTDHLTCPYRDPESFYLTEARWASMGWLVRWLLVFHNTLLGRLLLGPWWVLWRFWGGELRRFTAGDRRHLGAWIIHGIGVGGVLWWVVVACRLPLWQYLLLFVWPGMSLILLRSYLEHRPAASNGFRIAVVEAGWLTRLLFLNNNYHALHHEQPAMPWYALHRRYWAERDAVLARNGGFVISGYRRLFRYLLHPKDAPVHPNHTPVEPA